MNFENEKLEIKLDEVLDQKGPAGFEIDKNQEFQELLAAAAHFTEAEVQARAKESLAKILSQLPSSAHTTHKSNYSFSNFIHMATNRLRFVRPLGTALAVLFLLVGGISFYRAYSGQTPAGRGVAQIASPLYGGGGSGAMLEADSIGVATGLSAPSEGIIERAKNALGFSGSAYDVKEPSIAPLPPEYYPYPQPQTVPGSDTREYNKTSYYASVKSREANELAEQIQTMIRGWGGRIDNSSISDKNSYLSFVIPKSNLEQLRIELKNSAGVKFVTENMSSQNLLPQKRAIEDSTVKTDDRLTELKDSLAELEKKHSATLDNLNNELAATNRTLASLQAQMNSTTDTVKLGVLNNQLNQNRAERTRLQRAITTENDNYTVQKNKLDARIAGANKTLDNLDTQNTDLLESVEIVQGSVSFTKISIFEMFNIYLSGYLPAFVWVVIGGALLYAVRRRRPVDIEPVQ